MNQQGLIEEEILLRISSGFVSGWFVFFIGKRVINRGLFVQQKEPEDLYHLLQISLKYFKLGCKRDFFIYRSGLVLKCFHRRNSSKILRWIQNSLSKNSIFFGSPLNYLR